MSLKKGKQHYKWVYVIEEGCQFSMIVSMVSFILLKNWRNELNCIFLFLFLDLGIELRAWQMLVHYHLCHALAFLFHILFLRKDYLNFAQTGIQFMILMLTSPL
jgi:hypothetical protein